MRVGTKSVLFGYHQFLVHPLFTWAGWVSLYGWTWDPRIIAAFFLHDIGYVGKPNMDGTEGVQHPFAGAKVMYFLFDKPVDPYKTAYFYPYRKASEDGAIYVSYQGVEMTLDEAMKKHEQANDPAKWYKFSLYHSRQVARTYFQEPSKLCWADKKAFLLYPKWLLRALYFLSGEDREYRMNLYEDGAAVKQDKLVPFDVWYESACDGNKIPGGIDGKLSS